MSALAYALRVFPFIASPPGADDDGRTVRAGRRRLLLVRDAESSQESVASAGAGDFRIVERLKAGEEEALVEVVREYTTVLIRYARVIMGSDAVADDVVQDVFVALWEQRDGLQLRGALRQYLLGAVRHRALNMLRAERSRARTAEAAMRGIEAAPVSVNEAPGWLAQEDILTIVEQALEGVAPQCRMIFLLSWRGGLGYAEIARQLGVSLRTVYNQMYRATKVLGERLIDLDRE